MTFDWWISICFVCFCVSRFVACDCNMIDRSENAIVKAAFFTKMIVCLDGINWVFL